MGTVKNIAGKKFGRLTVLKYEGTYSGHARWTCLCDCGNKVSVFTTNLTGGGVQSCGCLQRESSAERHYKHGKSRTRLYNRWKCIKQRCYRVKDKSYHRYGGRGITMCDEWKNDFQAFYDWAMTNGYQDDLTIDRIDNDGNYEPSNCRWVSVADNNRNRANTRGGRG